MRVYYPQDNDEIRTHTFSVKTHEGKDVDLTFTEHAKLVKDNKTFATSVHFKKNVPYVEKVMERIMSTGISVENGRCGVLEVNYLGSKITDTIKPVEEKTFFDKIFKTYKSIYIPVRTSKITVI